MKKIPSFIFPKKKMKKPLDLVDLIAGKGYYNIVEFLGSI
jgi:hypothetical protein